MAPNTATAASGAPPRGDQEVERDERKQEPALVARQRGGVSDASPPPATDPRTASRGTARVTVQQRRIRPRRTPARSSAWTAGRAGWGSARTAAARPRRPRPAAEDAPRGGEQEHARPATTNETRRRDGARQPAAPQTVVRHERQHQQVRQGQPDGADLIEPGVRESSMRRAMLRCASASP